MADVLRRYRGNLNLIKDEEGNNLMIIATMSGSKSICDLLLQKGVDENFQNSNGDTPLHCAVLNRFHQVVDVLLSFGANENINNN